MKQFNIIFTFSVVFFFLNVNINVLAQQAEGTSQAGKVMILSSEMDFNEYVKYYVEDEIAAWQQKGEFEKTDAYKARVNEQSRRAKADELTANAIKELKRIYAKSIN